MERTPSAIVMNGKVVSGLTIKEVSETYDISADTLRYYERIGMIPEVHVRQAESETIRNQTLDGWSL